jgi:hypothetical protein
VTAVFVITLIILLPRVTLTQGRKKAEVWELIKPSLCLIKQLAMMTYGGEVV